MALRLKIAGAFLALCWACGSSTAPSGGNADAGTGDAGNGDAGNADAGNGDAGNADAGNADAGNADAGNADAGNADGGAATFTLTLNNLFSWCTITITQPAGAAFSSAAVALAAGTVVKLHGEPASSTFEWAPSAGHGGWSGAIDIGQDPLSKDTTITLTADKAVGVCCPFTNGTGCP